MSDELRAALTLIVCDPYTGLDKSDTRCTYCGGEWAPLTSFARHAEECPIQKVRRWLHTDEARHALTTAPAERAGERDSGWLLVDENMRLISLLGRLFRYARQLEDSRREVAFAERDKLFEEIEAAMTYSLDEFDARGESPPDLTRS